MQFNVATVIVTFNRKDLLHQALVAHSAQSKYSSKIFVIDNASTDSTLQMLQENGWAQKSNIELVSLTKNTGGAGGFSTGLRLAYSQGFEWMWIMDDDAIPHTSALEEISRIATDPSNIYGSLAVENENTSWLTTIIDPPLGETSKANDVPNGACVQSLPFLGFLIHRSLIDKIGFPDAGYFIAADDIEYCIRAQKHGANIIICSKSRIEHPKSYPYKVQFLGSTITCLALTPWKRYYDTRNRILIARSHYGFKLYTQTIPGSFLRFFSALKREPNKIAQSHAFLAGMIDGLLGLKGKRHSKWRIKQ